MRSPLAEPLRRVFQPSSRPPTLLPPFLLPLQQQQHSRNASGGRSKSGRKLAAAAAAKRKKARVMLPVPDLSQVPQFSLLDAMRYLKAAEVGQPPASAKYELHVRFRTLRSGPVIKSRVRLPHPVKTDVKIAVICPPDSAEARGALAAGAVMAGEEQVFDHVRGGKIDFDRLLCHPDSLQKLQKSGLAKTLGPKGLMPSVKTGTVMRDVVSAVRNVAQASEYRERTGVCRLAIGQLGYTPQELQRNIKAYIEALKKDIAGLSDRVQKEIHEIVLSSTNGPGLSLNGELRGANSPTVKDLAVN